MWSAIKSDLYEFISTVQEDAQDTISKVVDINPHQSTEEEEKITEEERILSEFRNKLSTYAEDVDPEQLPEFEKFVKSFSLSSKADEIEYILDLESGVTKHYEALVPDQISPELFWARYFFKVNVFIISSLGSVLESAYDEEEDLTWGEDEDECGDENGGDEARNVSSTPTQSTTSRRDNDLSLPSDMPTGESLKVNPSVSESAQVRGEDMAEEVAMIAAGNISELQEANEALRTRAELLESQVEKFQNQLIKERTLSTKVKNEMVAAEQRERELVAEVADLRKRLADAEALTASLARLDAKKESSPREAIDKIYDSESSLTNRSSVDSIVDLGSDLRLVPRPEVVGEGADSQQYLCPSEDSGSLKSVSSPSESSLCPSPTEKSKSKGSLSPDTRKAEATLASGAINNEDDDEEEEEWDNEAWG